MGSITRTFSSDRRPGHRLSKDDIEDSDELISQPPGHPKHKCFYNQIWSPIFTPELVRSAKSYKPEKGDVFICTYPKCGTTWTQHICSQLMVEDYDPTRGKELFITSPMIDEKGADFVKQLPTPRLLKTHFEWSDVPKSKEAKYIFVCRNPKDSVVSYYFMYRLLVAYDFANGDFDTFFDLFADGKLAYGDYFDHLKGWLEHIHDPNVLALRYEDMLDDLPGTIVKLGKFINDRTSALVDNEEVVARITQNSSFSAMSHDQSRWVPEACVNKTQGSFIRKGQKRDWINHLTKEQSDRIDELFRKKMKGTIAENWWQEQMSWD